VLEAEAVVLLGLYPGQNSMGAGCSIKGRKNILSGIEILSSSL